MLRRLRAEARRINWLQAITGGVLIGLIIIAAGMARHYSDRA